MTLQHLWQFSKLCAWKPKVLIHFMVLIQWLLLARQRIHSVTSMLVTIVRDQMCWWQVLDVSDKSRRQYNIGHQHHIRAYYDAGDRSICQQHTFFRQHLQMVNNLKMSPTSLSSVSDTPCDNEIVKDWKYETIYKSHSWENEDE